MNLVSKISCVQLCPKVLTGLILGVALMSFSPASAEEHGQKAQAGHSQKGKGHDDNWRGHEDRAHHYWNHSGYDYDPTVVYAPPLVYSPPPVYEEPGFNLILPLHIR